MRGLSPEATAPMLTGICKRLITADYPCACHHEPASGVNDNITAVGSPQGEPELAGP